MTRKLIDFESKVDYLSWRQYRYEVVVDASRLLFNSVNIRTLAQVFTGLPEHYVLLAILTLEKVPKHFPTSWGKGETQKVQIE